ncbi:hypothetical protein [Flavobacterium hydatis]|uniref:Uncharacterized protein n=1 Tax=Flavobacterium hydatis TaxID=991 RepID=A0A086AF00_FLAHY|nr:hypothetical protein [Flavobacterium hydatis]KFF15264.1 hypothetical protein IW20_15010 [Flavobacterium hydatis]OXA93032.1 hypothetical protein B0A62_14450 [Flavobacterium hydatis]
MIKKVICEQHGSKDMSFACIHLAMAIDKKEKVGFFYSEAGEDLPQIAWCGSCEQWLLDNGEEWNQAFEDLADFKILCSDCYDEAKDIQFATDKI